MVQHTFHSKGDPHFTVIGSGNFGTAYYDHEKNLVVKAMSSRDKYLDLKKEMDAQLKVYEAFEELKGLKDIEYVQYPKLTPSSKSLIEDVVQYVRISKPVSSSDKPITIDGIQYPCHFCMTELPRTLTKDLLKIDPHMFDKSMQSYRPSEFTTHLSFNTDRPSKLYPDVVSWKPFSDVVPLKEYHINNKYDITKLGIPLSRNRMKEMMGFVYSYIFFKLDMIPFDIEFTAGFTAGFDRKDFTMGVLDFGRISQRSGVSEERTIANISRERYCDN